MARAHEMAKKQQSISISQFFEKNRHLLGFDNPRKGLLTTIKEAVDNSLDACEEARILPEIIIEVIDMGSDRFKVIIEDNGPGIIKTQIPKIFAKLLYGSKFFSKKMSRGQQGIGISASVMYGQLTTGRPAKVISRIGKDYEAHYYELKINTETNNPDILAEKIIDWDKEHGTRIEIDLEGAYQKGGQSIDEYIKETAIVNPHVTLIYTNPKAEQFIFARATDVLPKEAKEIKPHPYGVELGILIKMLSITPAKTLQQFLMSEFTRVSATVAKEICENSSLLPKTKPKKMERSQSEQLFKGIKKTKIMNPPTDCISPITEESLKKGIMKEVNAEFYAVTTRPPSVYRGNPFQIEVALAYGGNQPKDKPAQLLRFANRVPLLYQQGGCAITKATKQMNWRLYGMSQSSGQFPQAPLTILVHIASVWVPFTSESKEAVAHYDEIIKEIKLALQDAGRKLGSYIKKKQRIQKEGKKRDYIKMYMPYVADALKDLLQLKEAERDEIIDNLQHILETKRGRLENVEFDASKNTEYDENFAKIGRGEEVKEEGDENE